MEPKNDFTPTAQDIERCTQILEAIADDALLISPLAAQDRVRLMVAAGRVIHPDKQQIRRRLKAQRMAKRQAREKIDRSLRASSAIRMARLDSVFIPAPKALESDAAPAQDRELTEARACYICKTHFKRVHFFYDSMCEPCAKFNYDKRFQTVSLAGRTALITGARLKIGYQAALLMLKAGAKVIVTTRFPQDAALRFAREPDFKDWAHKLQIHGLDLRHAPSVEVFTRFLNQTVDRLDFLINNAAQTVRRPPGFYAHLMKAETTPFEELPENVKPLLAAHELFKAALNGQVPEGADTHWLTEWHAEKIPAAPGLTSSAALSQIPYHCDDSVATAEVFPEGKLDADLQQVDLRQMNSWRMTLADVPTAEMLEVHLVNAVAPFILCAKLKPLMLKHPTGDKHIVNVSAMEGKFARHTKTDKHPHTNMAKAALNMMTLTSARDYAKHGIFMNAVDTGWVTDEDPAALSERKQNDHDFQPPLDIVDGAARICDPFISGLLTGKHSWGNFLKDYVPTEW